MKKILFVCLGNICRSPIAEGVAKKLADEYKLNCTIESAGTSGWHEGEAPCENSVRVAKKHGIDISKQTSRPITKHDYQKFDYVVAMDTQNKQDLEVRGFQKVHLLGEFGGYRGKDVPDPYYFQGFEGFEKVYSMIERSMKDFIEKVANGSI